MIGIHTTLSTVDSNEQLDVSRDSLSNFMANAAATVAVGVAIIITTVATAVNERGNIPVTFKIYRATIFITGTKITFTTLYNQDSVDKNASFNEISANFDPIANQASGEQILAKNVIGLNNQNAVLSILRNA